MHLSERICPCRIYLGYQPSSNVVSADNVHTLIPSSLIIIAVKAAQKVG